MSTLERLFDLRPGDLRRGTLLALYYFFILSAYTEGQVARDALFLGRFEALRLPYMDFIIAAAVGGILSVYFRMGRLLTPVNLLAASLGFFASNVLLFWWFAGVRQSEWIYPVIYIWVGIFGVLAIAQVWTLANHVLTNREAKRLFGFIGSGGILGGIFGGSISKLLSESLGVETVLLAMAVSIGISIVLVFRIDAQNRNVDLQRAKAIDAAHPATVRESLRLIRTSPHLLTIAALICICSVTTYIAGWQFKAIVRESLQDKDSMAAFFSSFTAVTGTLALAIEVLLTPRLLRRFGIGPALLFLPIALFGGTTALLVSGGLWAVTMLKGADKVVRYAVDTPALQLLYLPITADTKVQAKSVLDTVVLRAGDGVGAVLVLLLGSLAGMNPAQLGWIALAFLLLWMVVAVKASSQYVATLSDRLRRHRLDAEQLQSPMLDRSITQMVLTEIRSDDPAKIVYILNLLEGRRWKDAYSGIRKLLTHPSSEVRAKVISILRRIGDVRDVPEIEKLLSDPDLSVRTEALLFLSEYTSVDPLSRIEHLGDFRDFSIRAATVAFLARSEDPANLQAAQLILEMMVRESGHSGRSARLEAARLIRLLPDSLSGYLSGLLEDEDAEVLREAVRTAGARHDRQHVSQLITLLGKPKIREAARDALTQFGEEIKESLERHLPEPAVPLEVKREIPELLVTIGKRDARDALVANLRQPDSVLRFRIIASLNKLHKLYPDVELDPSIVEMVLASEIMNHWRSYQIMGKMETHLHHQSFNAPLQKSIDHELERIFRLLKMLYPQHDLQSAFVGLRSGNKAEHDSALEFIDNTLKSSIRRVLVPLVDGEISLIEKIGFANRLLQSTIDSKDDALLALMNTDDPWLKSCAAHLIGVLGLKQFQKEVNQWASDPDPVLREKAQKAQQRLEMTAP